MADKDKKEGRSFLGDIAHFYFRPDLHSVGALAYLTVFGFFTFYYIDNVGLAVRFLFYLISHSTALSGTALLFTGLSFVISLVMPFAVSLYAIFLLYEIWKRPSWSSHLKWVVTVVITIGAIFIILIADEAAHLAARAPVMQSFIEDANLTGKI